MQFRFEPPFALLTVTAFPFGRFLESRFPDGRALARKVADAVKDRKERRKLLANSARVADRLMHVADDRGVSVDHIIMEIRGAQTAVGPIFTA